MKYGKKILALFSALALAVSICAALVWADEDTKTLTNSDHFFVAKSKPSTLTSSNEYIRTDGSGRMGFVVFDVSKLPITDGNWQDYVANAPAITLSMLQSYTSAADFTCKIEGITTNKNNYDSTNPAFTVDDYNASGEELGVVSGTGVTPEESPLTLDITEFVKSQTDGKCILRFRGGQSSQIRFKTFTLTFDYSNAGKLTAAKEALALDSDRYTENFNLPTEGKFGAAVAWASDNDAISVDEYGAATVTRSEAGDMSVKLTATLSLGGEIDTKEFNVIVPQLLSGDLAKVIASADTYVQKNYDSGYDYTHNFYINGSGRQNFVRFAQSDVPTEKILHAELKLCLKEIDGDGAPELSLFGLTGDDKTKWLESDSYNYDTAAGDGLLDANLEGSFGSGEALGALQLSGTLTEGEWLSFDVTDYVQQQTDGVYSFRFYGTTPKTYFYTREIAGKEPYIQIAKGDTGAVLSDAAALRVPEKVYDSFQLPTTGTNGSSISWESDGTAITIDGGNAQVSEVETDTPVTLTATVSKGTANETRSFTVTVAPAVSIIVMEGAAVENDVLVPGAVRVGISGELPAETRAYIAHYGKNGALRAVHVLNEQGILDWTMDEDSGRLAVFVWDNDLKPVEAKSVSASSDIQ